MSQYHDRPISCPYILSLKIESSMTFNAIKIDRRETYFITTNKIQVLPFRFSQNCNFPSLQASHQIISKITNHKLRVRVNKVKLPPRNSLRLQKYPGIFLFSVLERELDQQRRIRAPGWQFLRCCHLGADR